MRVPELPESPAARRLRSVRAQQRLVLALTQHFSLGLKLVRIFHAHTQAGRVEQPLK